MRRVSFKIADIIIAFVSRFPVEEVSLREQEVRGYERFRDFFYDGSEKPEIIVEIKIAKRLPEIEKEKTLFVTYHPDDGSENWRLLKRGSAFTYTSPLKGKEQVAFVNKEFNRAEIFLLQKKKKGNVWDPNDVIYDFLQVLMILHLGRRNLGIFIHAMGLAEEDGAGLVFTGKSGRGKSTLANIWDKNTTATILNDDRLIVRLRGRRLYIFASPWHGDFNNYNASAVREAPLKAIFFIGHAKRHHARLLSGTEAFTHLYPLLFPAFWDRQCLNHIITFTSHVAERIKCLELGFAKNKSIISFVRNIARKR